MGNKLSCSARSSTSSDPPVRLKQLVTYEGEPRNATVPHLGSVISPPASSPSKSPKVSSPRVLHSHKPEGAKFAFPPPRSPVRGISELIDPQSVGPDSRGSFVQSPSGQILGREDFCAREDRPLSLRERQERIRQQSNGDQAYVVSGIPPKSRRASTYNMLDIPEEEDTTPPDGLPRSKTPKPSNMPKEKMHSRLRCC